MSEDMPQEASNEQSPPETNQPADGVLPGSLADTADKQIGSVAADQTAYQSDPPAEDTTPEGFIDDPNKARVVAESTKELRDRIVDIKSEVTLVEDHVSNGEFRELASRFQALADERTPRLNELVEAAKQLVGTLDEIRKSIANHGEDQDYKRLRDAERQELEIEVEYQGLAQDLERVIEEEYYKLVPPIDKRSKSVKGLKGPGSIYWSLVEACQDIARGGIHHIAFFKVPTDIIGLLETSKDKYVEGLNKELGYIDHLTVQRIEDWAGILYDNPPSDDFKRDNREIGIDPRSLGVFERRLDEMKNEERELFSKLDDALSSSAVTQFNVDLYGGTRGSFPSRADGGKLTEVYWAILRHTSDYGISNSFWDSIGMDKRYKRLALGQDFFQGNLSLSPNSLLAFMYGDDSPELKDWQDKLLSPDTTLGQLRDIYAGVVKKLFAPALSFSAELESVMTDIKTGRAVTYQSANTAQPESAVA